ncbi:MAG: glycosyltransferase [Eubacteriales bacterium]|nr:glycosyltransferase [Eubacteriales bacterium]
MIGFYIELAIILLGFAAAILLFYRIPRLPQAQGARNTQRVSVVIPARNEESTLPLLLADLAKQALAPFEILVVNDASEDATEQVARDCGAKVLTLNGKPDGWVGKSWACQKGAESADGELIVFLDADVRLSPDGLGRIVEAYRSANQTISVQPYHQTQKGYEQFSLLFNLIQVGANGTALPRPVPLGLFGPIIAISRADYFTAGGHESVKASIVEDMALACELRRANIPFRVFVGDRDVSFRMYPAGFRSLWQGFSKNLATGASKIPAWLILLVTLFVASVASVPLHLLLAGFRGEPVVLVYALLYGFWVLALFLIGRRIGRYSPAALLLYPVPLTIFLLVSLYSGYLRLFRRNVRWKGRAIPLER